MGYLKYLEKNLREGTYDTALKQRLVEWRKQTTIVKAAYPTNPRKAKLYGYRAKQGFVIARVRIGKGMSKRERPSGGRRPAASGQVKYTPKQSQKWICEQRASRRFPGLEVIGSYYVAEDGQRVWYEIILINPFDPSVKSVKELKLPKGRGWVWRGLTPAGRRSRGLRKKGRGTEHTRPSKQAAVRRKAKNRAAKGRRQKYFLRRKVAKK